MFNNKKIINTIIILFLPILVFYIYRSNYGYIYHTVDDVVISYSILKNDVILLPYVGIILSSTLGFLQTILGNINIFFVFLIVTYFISFSIYIYLTTTLINNWTKYLLITLILILEFISLRYFTYSVIAYLLAIAGVLLLLKTKHKFIATLIIFLGVSLRPQIMSSLLILLIPIILYEVLQKKKYKNVILMFSVFAVVLGSNKIYSTFDKITKEYLEWNEKSTLIRDYPAIDYADKKESLEKADISENDLNSYNAWIFSEKKLFNNEFLTKLNNIKNINEKYNLSVKDIIIELSSNYFIKSIIFFNILLLIFYRVKNIYGYGIILTPLLLFTALVIRQRLVERIYIPIILIFIVSIIIYFKDFYEKRSFSKLFNTEAIIFSICTCLLLNQNITYGKENLYWFTPKEYTHYSNYNDEVNNNPNILYIFVGYGNLVSSQPNVAKVFPNINRVSSNVTTLGNWQTFSKRYYENLTKLNIKNEDNLLSESLDNKQIKFVIADNSSAYNYIKKLFEEHYNKNVYFEKEKELSQSMAIYNLREAE